MSAGAIIAMDGFEVGNSPIYFLRQGTRSASDGRTGSYGSLFSSSGFPLNNFVIDPVAAEVCVGVAFRCAATVNGTYAFLTIVANGTVANLPSVSLALTTQHLLLLQTPDGSGAYINRALSTFQLRPDTWYFIELYALASVSGGIVTVQVNGPGGQQGTTGAEVMTVTGIRTLHHTATGNYLIAQYGTPGGFSSDIRTSSFDDFHVRLGDHFVGDSQVIGLQLESDRAVDFTPSTGGDNFAMVDDTSSDGDSTYNHTNVDQDQDIFETVDVSDPGTILALQVAAIARGTVAGEWALETAVDLSGTFAYGDPQTLTASYPTTGVPPTVYMEAPGSLAWTLARLNAAGIGYRTNAV